MKIWPKRVRRRKARAEEIDNRLRLEGRIDREVTEEVGYSLSDSFINNEREAEEVVQRERREMGNGESSFVGFVHFTKEVKS